MLKIITSVVLSLVTIMAVTLFAVTVPAQSQKIDENAAAIVKAQTDAETNAYNKVKEDILSDMSGTTLEDVGTAISALQDDVAELDNLFLPTSLAIITGSGTTENPYLLTDNYTKNRVLKCLPIAIKGGGGNNDWLIFYAERKNTAYGATKITYYYISGGSQPARITYESYTFDFTTWTVSKFSIYSTGTT